MRTARFDIEFALPNVFAKINQFSPDMQKVHLYCDAVTLPGLSVLTSESISYGEQRELPYGKQFENVSLSFYTDNSMDVKLLFDNWISNIQDPRSRTMNYYKDYITDLKIIVSDTQEKKRYMVTLYECYPKALGSVNMDMASKDVMKIQVSMNYKWWESKALGSVENTSSKEPDTNPISQNFFGNSLNQSFENARNQLFDGIDITTGTGFEIL